MIELLVVVAIIGVLASLMIPAISGAHSVSQTSVCKNNQGQLLLASSIYRNDFEANPPAVVSMLIHWDDEAVLWQYVDQIKEEMICPNHSDPIYSITGYNYNTMLGDEYQLGSGITIKGIPVSDCKHPARCAMFGEGYDNKFMRATQSNINIRCGGRQSFRHRDSTVVGWLDGHVSVQTTMFNNGCDEAPNVGFLSEDNSAYDPRTMNLD